MNISAPFIQRPVMTTFVMLSMLLAGWIAFLKLPVSDLPPIEKPIILVKADYTGANPETILNQVTIPLEKELTHVKGVEEISSSSSSGNSAISLKFGLDKNMDDAIRDVQAALNRAEEHLPLDLNKKPSYHFQEDSQEPIMYMVLTSDHLTAGELHTYAENYIIPRLSRIEGVAQVKTFGPPKSIWLRIHPELMAARNIGFNEVIATVKQHTTQMPLGSIQTSSKLLTLELSGKVNEWSEIENLKIGNHPVRIKDIGEVSNRSESDQEIHYVTQDKTRTALILGVQKISDANAVSISQEVQEALKILHKELPPSVHLKLWFDKAIWINESIVDVEWSLFIAFLLVVVVIFLSLGRLSEALITSLSLPFSLIGTFVAMYMLDFNLDLLSLLALTLSVGFVVDDAIVVLENIVRHQELGEDSQAAALNGSKQIGFTILSMTLSLVAVFIPLLFMTGMNGRLFREFSVTLAVAILVSGFVSLTLTPMLCSRFLRSHQKETKLQSYINKINQRVVGWYGSTLKLCFKYTKSILSLAAISVVITGYLFTKLPVNLIPPEDRGFLFAFVNLPTGLGAEAIKDYQKKLEGLIKENTDIENFLDVNFNGNLLFIMRLLPLEERAPQAAIMQDLQIKLNQLPGILAFIKPYQLINLDLDISSTGNYKFLIRGKEFHEVEKATEQFTKLMQTNPLFTFAQHSLQNDAHKLVIKIDDEIAHQFGLNKREVEGLLQHAYGQGTIGSLQKGAVQEKIYLELLPDYRNSAAALQKVAIRNLHGELIPLKAIASWKEQLGSPSLVRREQLPSATIRFSLADTVAPNQGLNQLEELAKKHLPDGVTGILDGAAKAVSSTIKETSLLLLAAALVMYIVLGILYESFIHPLTILSSLPLAGLGGVLTLFLFNEPVSIFSAVGFLLLIGIVKKNGIMMIDYALEAQAHGKSPSEAIYEACLVRFRPIMMTTVAAIMGAVPIAIGFGDGAEMRRGLGLVIVGGLLFSQILTLYVTPLLYLTFEKLRRKKNSHAATAVTPT